MLLTLDLDKKIIYTVFLVVAMHVAIICLLSLTIKNGPSHRPQKLIVQTITLEKPAVNPVTTRDAKSAANPLTPKAAAAKPEETKKSKEIAAPPLPEVKKPAVAPSKAAPTPKPEPKKPASTKPAPKASETKTVKKTEVKAEPARSEPTKKVAEENAAKAEAAAKKKKLLADAQKNLGKSVSTPAKAEINKSKEIALAAPPSNISSLQADSIGQSQSTASIEMNYSQELSNRLKRLLRLPQYGEVDIQLTLLRSGKVSQLTIIESQNPANRDYVEKTVPGLQFSPFGSAFAGEQQHTFKIKLRHE